MTFDEVRQQIERLRTINRAIDRIGDRVADLRSKADGVHAQRFDTVRNCSGRHDAFESGVIDYVEKTQEAQIALLDLSFEQMELEGKLMEISGDTDDYEIADLIGRYFESYM